MDKLAESSVSLDSASLEHEIHKLTVNTVKENETMEIAEQVKVKFLTFRFNVQKVQG